MKNKELESLVKGGSKTMFEATYLIGCIITIGLMVIAILMAK